MQAKITALQKKTSGNRKTDMDVLSDFYVFGDGDFESESSFVPPHIYF